MLLTLLYIFIGIVIVQLFYYLGIFREFVFSQPAENNPKRIPVSVILYAKNNAEEVRKIMPLLLNQNYHEFELVLVNNASFDETLDIFKEYASMYPNIRIVDVENNQAFWGSKKYALTLGIKASKHEYLLFIDAENRPSSETWLMQMSSHFTLNKTIVLGTSMYEKKKGFFNKIIRYDMIWNQLHSFAWTRTGNPFTVNLKNIAYKKEEFYKVKGFIDHMQNPKYENDLFVNQAATGKNTTLCEQPSATLIVPVLKNYRQFVSLKKEHSQLLNTFKFATRFKIKLFNISQLCFYLMAIVLLILQIEWEIVVALLIFRFLFVWLIASKAVKKFQQPDLALTFPLIEIAQLITLINVSLKSVFNSK